MSRYSRPIPAFEVGIHQTIIPTEPSTVCQLLDEFSELVADLQRSTPSLVSDETVQKKLRDFYQRFRQTGDMDQESSLDSDRSPGDEPDTELDEGNEIVELSQEEIQQRIHRAQENGEVTSAIMWSALGLLQRLAYAKGMRKPVQQINAVVVFHTLIDTLGIKYFDPRGQSHFQEYLNQAMAAGLIKYSTWISKDAIRAYRNAEQSGRIIQLTKLPSKFDPSKVTDYYSFLPEGGRAAALKDLRVLGITEQQIQDLSESLLLAFWSEIQQARAESEDVESRITR